MSTIGFAGFEIFPTTSGGAGVLLDAIIDRLVNEGHTVVLLLAVDENAFSKWINEDIYRHSNSAGIRSYRLDDLCKDMPAQPENFPSNAHLLSYKLSYAVEIIQRDERCDLFEFVDYCGTAYYALLRRILNPKGFPPRIAVRFHNTIEIIHFRTQAAYPNWRLHDFALERKALALADMVLCSGPRFAQDEVWRFYQVQSPRLAISPPPCRNRPLRKINNAARDILFFGRLSTFKGLDRFLHAAVGILANPDTRDKVGNFLVVGPSETVVSSYDERKLLSIADKWLGKRIILTGRLSHPKMEPYAENAACAVFPNEMESFCYAAHELFLSGIPLILSRSPTFLDYFEDHVSAVFFDGSIPDLIDKILLLARDSQLRELLRGSVPALSNRYRSHAYEEHLQTPAFDGPKSSELLSYLAILDSPDDIAMLRDAAPRYPQGNWILAVPSALSMWRVFGCGRSFVRLNGTPIVAPLQAMGEAVAVVDPRHLPTPAFVESAQALLASDPRIGAVVPSTTSADGRWMTPTLPVTLETEVGRGRPRGCIVRCLVGTTLADVLRTGEDDVEFAALWDVRERKQQIVDLPMASFETSAPLEPSDVPRTTLFLRKKAWSIDRITAAAIASDFLGGRCQVIHEKDAAREWFLTHILKASLENDQDVLICSLPKQKSNLFRDKTPFITICRCFASSTPAVMPWSKLKFDADWEYVYAADFPSGFRRTRRGTVAIPYSDQLRISFIAGPDQGTAVIAYRGRMQRLSLLDNGYSEIGVDVGELFRSSLSPSLRRDGSNITAIAALADLETIDEAVFVLRQIDVPLARYAGMPEDSSVIVLEPLLKKYDLDVVANALASKESLRRLTFIEDAALVDLIERIVLDGAGARVRIICKNAIEWHADGLNRLLRLVGLQRTHAGRVELVCMGDELPPLMRHLGADCAAISVLPPRAEVRPATPKMTVVLSEGNGSVPSTGHLAAALAMLPNVQQAKVDRLLYPKHAPLLNSLLASFGLAHLAVPFDDLADTLSGLRGQRFIYFGPFPDGCIDAGAVYAVQCGGLPLVGVGALAPTHQGSIGPLTAENWEDSLDLASKLAQLIDGYDEIQKSFLRPA